MKKDATAGTPNVVLLYCRQCVAADVSAADFPNRAEMLPCSSKIRVSHLMKILAGGADAVELVACPEESCRQMVGSRRAERRVEYARGLLVAAGISGERIGISRGTDLSAQDLRDLAAQRAKKLRSDGAAGEEVSG